MTLHGIGHWINDVSTIGREDVLLGYIRVGYSVSTLFLCLKHYFTVASNNFLPRLVIERGSHSFFFLPQNLHILLASSNL